ncbi:MAG: carboxy terminal-processing peptidase, partial [Coleofasciculus sp. C2-GNP5-27]
ALLPQLKAEHESRAAESPDFRYLIDQIERSREARDREQLSLNEVTVKADRERNRREEFDAENLRRLLKGMELLPWEDEETTEDEQAPAIAQNNDDLLGGSSLPSDAQDDEDEPDPLLLESGRILADWISFSERQISRVDNLPDNR